MLDLLNFQKPQRYIGNELNIVKKNHSGKISFCLCYPNFYEIGMDNLGLRIIYGLLNSYHDLVCERAFLPGQDLLDYLEKEKKLLFSLETKKPLSDFDLVGFNFGYELNYLNFLQMLESGGIPLKNKERKNTIIIGGGIANPEPLVDFVDVFCLGEFEAVSDKLIWVLRKYKDKTKRLEKLAQIDGFYVPRFYNLLFSKNYYSLEKRYPAANSEIKQAKVKNLNKSFFPLSWMTPHTRLSQDRVPIEIARGCPNNCNFCQARNVYYPYREKNVKTILKTIKTVYKNSGYEKFSLLSLSTSNYLQIEKLIKELLPFIVKNKISLNFPSLRIGKEIEPIYKKLLAIQKTSLTIALEAGRACFRKKLNKNIEIENLFNSADVLSRLGLRMIKVYFMYGFPDEKKEDLLAIGNLIKEILERTKFRVNVSLNLFIPKPFSPWEDKPLLDSAKAKEKRDTILANIPKRKRIKLSYSSINLSLIEAIISRGSRDLGPVFIEINKQRKKLLEKNLLFSWPIWKDTLEKKGIDWQRYVRAKTKNFPWSFIK